MPKRGMKFKKYHKLQINPTPTTQHNPGPDRGFFILRTQEPGRITKVHLDAVRRAIRRAVRRQGKILFPAIAYHPISAKPNEIRQGKGKDAIDYWAMPISSGYSVIQMRGIFINFARRALFTAATKLPLRTYLDTKARFKDWDDFIDFSSDLRIKNIRKQTKLGMLSFYVPRIDKSV